MTNKRYTYVIDNGQDTIYDLSKKGVILENFVDIEETLNSQQEKITELEKEIAQLTLEVEALKQIKPSRKLPREVNVLKLDNEDV